VEVLSIWLLISLYLVIDFFQSFQAERTPAGVTYYLTVQQLTSANVPCYFCGALFDDLLKLEEHVTRVHIRNVTFYACTLCQRAGCKASLNTNGCSCDHDENNANSNSVVKPNDNSGLSDVDLSEIKAAFGGN
jgi:hypothetical protein